jgi:nickel transport protein
MIRISLTIILLSAFLVPNTWPHGLFAAIDAHPSVVLRFKYSSGEPLAYAMVTIFEPEEKNIEYQNGRTDAEGRFAFVPLRPGTWIVHCSDGMGHRVNKEIVVDDAIQVQNDRAIAQTPLSKALPTLLGISLIAHCVCLIRWFKSRKK